MDTETFDQTPNIDLNTHLEDDEMENINVDDCCESEQIEVENIKKPELGMEFDTFDDLLEFYRKYGNELGFPVKQRSTKRAVDGDVRWVAISCAREGKSISKTKNSLKLNPISRTGCKAKVRAVLSLDGKWKLTSIFLDHNHALSPGKSRYYRTNRVISSFVKRKLEMNDRAGIRANKSFNACVVEAGGNENVPFLLKDCYNHIDKMRQLRLGEGDALAVQNYFLKMQANNANFFYVMDLDNDGRLKNLFWADARSRAAYEEFGDAITFDTTYLTNKYDMPFAPFVGVNHHGQSILLGCGLISNEDTDTFTWLFKSWLTCMKDRAPKAIITDQDRAMKNAIEIVFPNTRHRWCLWHIMKKLPEKLSSYQEYKSMKSSIKQVVYDSLTTIEFEESWNRLIGKHALEKNEWLSGLFNERHRWVPVFVKDSFWAGMSTTQRSESMNAFFDGYVHSKTTLKQFVEQYENALRSKVEKEAHADFNSFHASIPCVTKYKVEKQFQECYTIEKFREVQKEVTGKLYCSLSLVEKNVDHEVYEVSEDMVGVTERDTTFTVSFNPRDCDVKCNCRLFEFRGILCRHTLTVLIHNKIHNVPEKYIIRRWRKDVKRCYNKVKIIYSNWAMNPENERTDRMCNAFYEVVDLACDSEDKAKMVMNWIKWLKDELKNSEGASASSQPISLPVNRLNSGSTGEDNGNTAGSGTVQDPLVVRGKGRPPFKRHQGTVEKVVRNKKAKKTKEKESASHMQQASQGICSDYGVSQGISTDCGGSQIISSQLNASKNLLDISSGSHVPNFDANVLYGTSYSKLLQDYTVSASSLLAMQQTIPTVWQNPQVGSGDFVQPQLHLGGSVPHRDPTIQVNFSEMNNDRIFDPFWKPKNN